MDATLDNFLHRLPLMAGVDEGALRFLSALAVEEHYAAGDTIMREGEPGDRMFFIHSGRVRIVKGPGETPVCLAEMGPGDFFGEMSLVESVVRSASVVAVGPVRGFTLRGLDFYKLYRVHPAQYGVVMLNLARDLARRLRRLDEKFAAAAH